MNQPVYDFTFIDSVPLKDAERTLQSAFVAAECLYGDAQVKLDGNYFVNRQDRAIAIGNDTEVGADICRIFTGLLNREFGRHAFKVTSRTLAEKEVTS